MPESPVSMVSLKQRLANQEQVTVFAVGRSFHPNQIEMYGLQGGFAGFWIDQEHSAFTMEQMESATRAGRVWGMDSFVRIPPTDYATVTRCLESGAGGIMAAQISSPEQAEAIVQWSKFGPRGSRGMNAGGHDGQFGLLPLAEFAKRANERTFVAIQIETVAAVDCCEEIAAIDGVDLLFIGPADLSQAYGVIGQAMHSHCLSAIAKVSHACEKHGKNFGAVSFAPEHTTMLLDQGCRMISITNDVRTFQDGIVAVKQRFPMLFP